ncbi:MAG TPA: hypothetical protein VKA47_03650 [Solirubrobacterales bacterium]|nr:hypothetical protein [Solirubrobacterales bacterium]
MCGSHREHSAGHRWRHRSGRFGNREQWLSRLEEYQRDLEEELADVADMIRRLKEDAPQQPASV